MEEKLNSFVYSKYFPGVIYTLVFIGWWLMILIAFFGEHFIKILDKIIIALIPFFGYEITKYINIITVRDIWWLYWWPLLLLSILFVSRGWCGWLCPLGSLSEFFNRFKFTRKTPGWVLLGWGSVLVFLTVIVSERFFGYIGNPQYSAIFFIVLSVFAGLIGLLFIKRTWCKFFCPIGVFLSVFSRLGILYFEATDKNRNNGKNHSICGEVCPTFVNLYKSKSNADCIMCFRCAKVCRGIKLKFRTPGKELMDIKNHSPKKTEAVFLLIILGLMPTVLLLNKPIYQEVNNFFTDKILRINFETLSLGDINILAFFTFILLGIIFVFSIIYLVSYVSALFIKSENKTKGSINNLLIRLFYIYTPMSFFGLFVITGGPLLLKIGYHEITTLLALSIGAVWSSFLGYEIISKEMNEKDEKSQISGLFKAVVPHIFGISFLYTLYIWVAIFV